MGGVAVAEEPVVTAGWSSFQNGGRPVSLGKLPTSWSPEDGVAWKAEMAGYGQSTPVLHDGRLFVTSTSGANKEVYQLTAIDLVTGEKRWQLDLRNPSPEANNAYVSRAAPSPVADGDGVIALFEGGICVAVDGEGTVRWQRDLVEAYGPIDARHGLAASLEQDATRVFVWIERSGDPYVLALDKKTGETVWKAPGLGASGWASPRLIPTEWGDQLVCSGSGKLVGFDPQAGERLWEFTEISNNTTCTPMPVSPGRFLIGASDGRGEVGGGNAAASNGVIEIVRDDQGKFAPRFLWRAERAVSSFASPVAAAGKAWIVNRAGVLYRLDLETGEEISAKRTDAGGVWATPLITDEHLYLAGTQGETSVFSLQDGSLVAHNRLWESDAAAGAAPGGREGGGVGQGPPLAGRGATLYSVSAAPPYLIFRRGDRLIAVKE
ncbi:MAG: serine/threonine protein kinase [Planctomycetaceae bacterium]|nr:MAG: serine/threonine protein kinase [Planctomycetaceae bacterium]